MAVEADKIELTRNQRIFMMLLKLIPVNVISAPNFWSATKESFWTVTANQPNDLWGLLTIVDSLGSRAYVPALGSTLQILFQRGDYIGSITNQNLSVTKTAAMDTNNRALMKIGLIAQEATNIISGTAVFTLTEGAVVQKWTQNWAIKKINTSAGF